MLGRGHRVPFAPQAGWLLLFLSTGSRHGYPTGRPPHHRQQDPGLRNCPPKASAEPELGDPELPGPTCLGLSLAVECFCDEVPSGRVRQAHPRLL